MGSVKHTHERAYESSLSCSQAAALALLRSFLSCVRSLRLQCAFALACSLRVFVAFASCGLRRKLACIVFVSSSTWLRSPLSCSPLSQSCDACGGVRLSLLHVARVFWILCQKTKNTRKIRVIITVLPSAAFACASISLFVCVRVTNAISWAIIVKLLYALNWILLK